MIDWKGLAEKGDYQEIIAHGKEAISASDHFYLASAYLALGRGKEAMDLLLSKRDFLWKENPALLLKANFETRFALNEFDEAYEDLQYFSNLNYVSQEIEEILRSLPKRIRLEELSGGKKTEVDEVEVHRILQTERDPSTLLAYLNALKKSDLMPYFSDLHNLLASDEVEDDVKSYVLMLCSAHHDEVTVSFEKGGKRFTLIPAEVRMPYSTESYRKMRNRILEIKDTSLSSLCGELLDQTVLALYPDPYEVEDLEVEEEALKALALAYLGQSKPTLNPKAQLRLSTLQRLLKVYPKA
ncbi:MAG: hypothetical protein ACI32C_03160 [Candidatus Enteromonas sp.]